MDDNKNSNYVHVDSVNLVFNTIEKWWQEEKIKWESKIAALESEIKNLKEELSDSKK